MLSMKPTRQPTRVANPYPTHISYFPTADLHLERPPLLLQQLARGEDLLHGSRYHPSLCLHVWLPQHGVGLAGPSLAVRKDAHLEGEGQVAGREGGRGVGKGG